MQYALLIHDDHRRWQATPEAEQAAVVAAYDAFFAALREAGVFKSAARLAPADTATTVRVRDERALVTDGPFAETKEQLSGFFLVECENLDEALAWAQRLPGARTGTIEVRPLHRPTIDA